MSSTIDPIIQVQGKRKLVKVSIALAAGTAVGNKQVTGLEYANQVVGAYLTGAGATVTNGFLVDPFVGGGAPNVVGISTLAGNVTAELLVQGY